MRTKLLCTLLLLAVAVIPTHQNDTHQTIEAKYVEAIDLTPAQAPKYYKLDISNLPDETDISISLRNREGISPQIYVSNVTEFPSRPDNSDYSIIEYKGGVVFIPWTALRKIKMIYIGLHCIRPLCQAQFNVEYSKEIYVSADGIHHYYHQELEGASSAVIRLVVPDEPLAERIVIHTDAIGEDWHTTPYLDLFINKGDKIPDSMSAESVPRSSWFGGRTIVFYKGSEMYCTNCVYTISAKFSEGSSLRFESTVMQPTTPLRASFTVDAIQPDKANLYTFDVTDATKDKEILIDLTPQIGSVKLEIRCDDDADRYWSYQIDRKKEEIILSPREHANCTTNTYRITVTSSEQSIYSIRASTREFTGLFLSKGSPVIGTIEPNESLEYEVSIPLFGAEKINILFETQRNVTFSIINCRFPTECPSFATARSGTIQLNATIGEFTYEIEKLPNGTQKATIDPHSNGCYPILVQSRFSHLETMPICAYKITVTSGETTKADYKISTASEGHQYLFPGEPKRDFGSSGDIAYYIFKVNQANTTSVSFQMTVFSGSAELLVSRTELYPTNNTGEAQIYHEDFIVFQNITDLRGDYYVGVKMNETSSYMITANALDLNGTLEDYAILLQEGHPQKGVLLLKHEYPVQFYRFDVNFEDSWEGLIRINLISLRGKIFLAATTEGSIPNPILANWRSTGGLLEIDSTHEHFIRRGTYHVGVFVDWTDPRAYNIFEITYLINYHIEHREDKGPSINTKHIILTSFFPYHGMIRSEQLLYFKVFILPNEKKITLFKTADAGDIDIYASLSSHNQYPDAKNYTVSTKDTHQDQLTFTENNFEEACKDKLGALCEINFVVMTSAASQGNISFAISLTRDDEARKGPVLTALQDGKESRFATPDLAKPAIYYYYPSPKQDIFITVSCPHKEITIYANKNEINMSDPNHNAKKVPTPDEYDYASPADRDLKVGFTHLMIPGDQDAASPIIAIAVYFHNIPGAAHTSDSGSFSITASSHTTEIYTGKPVLSMVTKDAYQYYFLNVHRKQCTLVITLTTLDDGDPDLVISQGWLSRPTMANHKFASVSKQRTESLKISERDVYPADSMEGIWIFGVYGKLESAFALTVVYEDHNIVDLYQGIPLEMYLEAKAEMNFKYLHLTKSDFDLKIDQHSGALLAYITVVQHGEAIQDRLPTKANADWTIDPFEDPALRISGNCTNCIYLIKIEVQQSSKFLIMAIEEQSSARIQSSFRYEDEIEPGKSKKYMFFARNFAEITFNAGVTAGALDIYISNNPVVNNTHYISELHLTSKDLSVDFKLDKALLGTESASKPIFNGVSEVTSLSNVFFFYFENKGTAVVSYNFVLIAKDTSIIVKLGTAHDFTFESQEKKSFLYYSPYISGVTTVELSYCVTLPKPKNERERSSLLSQALEGMDFEAEFWSQKVTAGVGDDIFIEKDDIFLTTVEDVKDEPKQITCLKQNLVFDNQNEEGRYEFLVTNPYSQLVPISIHIDTTEVKYKLFERNTQYLEYVSPGDTKNFEILLPEQGTWFFTVLACQGKVSVHIGESSEALDALDNSRVGLQYSGFNSPKKFEHRIWVPEATTRFVRIKGIETESQVDGDMIEFAVFSSFFQNENLNGYTSLTPKSRDLFTSDMQHSYNFDYETPELSFSFSPPAFQNFEKDDSFSYYIRLCPKDALLQEENYCVPFHPMSECRNMFKKGEVGSQTQITQLFQKVPPGSYSVHLVTSINHDGSNVIPYPHKRYDLELKEPIAYKLWDFIYFIAVTGLIAVVLLLFYRKMRKMKIAYDNSRNSGNVSSRPYDMIGYDEDQ